MALKTDFRHADFGAVSARPLFILLTSRLVALADVVEVFHRAGGTDPGRKPASPRERMVPGAQDPHPGDPRSFGVLAVQHPPVAERGRGFIADPFPQWYGAAERGVLHQGVLGQVPGMPS
jgi:hypothetical protein